LVPRIDKGGPENERKVLCKIIVGFLGNVFLQDTM